MAHVVKKLPAKQETWVSFLGREGLLEEDTASRSSLLGWRSP